MKLRLTKHQEGVVRRMAHAERCPVVVLDGNQPPTAEGERGRYEFKNGGECKYPGSARRKGFKINYIGSTYRVVVGYHWLLSHDAAVGLGLADGRQIGVLAKAMQKWREDADVPASQGVTT